MIPAERPFSMASVKNVLVMILLRGRPKLTFDTPSTVLTPKVSLIFFNASRVTEAFLISVLTVMVRESNIRSFLSIPYSFALFIIFSAIATRASAVSGIPVSSRVSATTQAPYFFAKGNTASILSCLPFTLFSRGLPL